MGIWHVYETELLKYKTDCRMKMLIALNAHAHSRTSKLLIKTKLFNGSIFNKLWLFQKSFVFYLWFLCLNVLLLIDRNYSSEMFELFLCLLIMSIHFSSSCFFFYIFSTFLPSLSTPHSIQHAVSLIVLAERLNLVISKLASAFVTFLETYTLPLRL